MNLKVRNLTEVYFVYWFLRVSFKNIFNHLKFRDQRTLPTQNATTLIISVKIFESWFGKIPGESHNLSGG